MKKLGILALSLALPLLAQAEECIPPLPGYQTVPSCLPPCIGKCCTPKRCETPCCPNPFLTPFQLRGNYLRTGEAKFDNGDLARQRFRFEQWDAGAAYLTPTGCMTGVAPALGYRQTNICWHDSPFLDTRTFQEVYVGAFAFTRCLDCWFWKAGFGWWQQLYRLQLGHYGMLDTFLWGRYQWWCNMGVHIGFLVQAGRRQGFVRPIIGVDWEISDRWTLNLVYPVDVGLFYNVTPAFSLAIAGRPNRTRLRLQDDDPVPEGLIEYRMWGVEGRATYEPSCRFKFEAFVGSTIWSFIKLNNEWNKRIVFSNLRDTWFAGGHIYLSF